MKPIEVVLAKFPDAKKVGKGWRARCPAHDDRKPSLSITECSDGTVLIKCHADCQTSAILTGIGLKLANLFPSTVSTAPTKNGKPKNGKPKPSGPTFSTANDAVAHLERLHGKRSALWTYHDPDGKPVGLVIRWDTPNGKEIRPVSLYPLYGLPELAKATRVIVC